MPALITPFDTEGELDLDAHRHNVRFLAQQGATGFVVGGSTGEGPYLEPGDRAHLVATARQEVPDAFVLCGIHMESVRQATERITEAHTAGADAALVITPTTIIRGDDEAVARFYIDVAEATPLPLFLYTVPAVSGYELPVSSARRLSAHPGIVGMKDSGGGLDRVVELAGTLSEPFYLFVGATRIVGSGIGAGAYGAVMSCSNYAWPIASRLVAATREPNGDFAGYQERLTALTGTIEPLGRPATKAAAAMVGMRPGVPRRPLRPLASEHLPAIESALKRAGLSVEAAAQH